MQDCKFAATFAELLRKARLRLVSRWLALISARATHDPPTPEMVESMPVLIDGIAWYLEHPGDAISTDTAVVDKAAQLGALRHAQGFGVHEILEEYGLLGCVLFDYLAASDGEQPCESSELLVCGYRLFNAIRLIEITTTTHFIHLGHKQVAEREGRLRAFNRAVSHEIKNRIGTVISAGELLSSADPLPPDRRAHFAGILTRNAQEMRGTVDNLLVLARVEHDPKEHRHVPLSALVKSVAKQVHASAEAANVDVQIASLLPQVEVNEAVHLLLANYVTNAIKYSDREAPTRYVRVDATIATLDRDASELVVRVQDNGVGVPVEKRDALFQRFFRAHHESRAQGTGLGLSIVRDVVTAIGGRAWADFPEKGSIFAFAVPYRPANRATSNVRQERRKR